MDIRIESKERYHLSSYEPGISRSNQTGLRWRDVRISEELRWLSGATHMNGPQQLSR